MTYRRPHRIYLAYASEGRASTMMTWAQLALAVLARRRDELTVLDVAKELAHGARGVDPAALRSIVYASLRTLCDHRFAVRTHDPLNRRMWRYHATPYGVRFCRFIMKSTSETRWVKMSDSKLLIGKH